MLDAFSLRLQARASKRTSPQLRLQPQPAAPGGAALSGGPKPKPQGGRQLSSRPKRASQKKKKKQTRIFRLQPQASSRNLKEGQAGSEALNGSPKEDRPASSPSASARSPQLSRRGAKAFISLYSWPSACHCSGSLERQPQEDKPVPSTSASARSPPLSRSLREAKILFLAFNLKPQPQGG